MKRTVMANPALNIQQTRNFLIKKDILIFDANSQSAHIIARTILVNDPSQKFHLIPRQSAAFFGVELPHKYEKEKFILMTQTGETICGKNALSLISERLKLATQIH